MKCYPNICYKEGFAVNVPSQYRYHLRTEYGKRGLPLGRHDNTDKPVWRPAGGEQWRGQGNAHVLWPPHGRKLPPMAATDLSLSSGRGTVCSTEITQETLHMFKLILSLLPEVFLVLHSIAHKKSCTQNYSTHILICLMLFLIVINTKYLFQS